MKKFNDENDILNQTSNNQWLLSLQKACKKFYSSFLKNAVIANISSGNFDEKFKELFKQAQNSNVILENKGTERDGNVQNKRDINTNFEDENKNHSTNNNQSSKWCLCQGCNCSCWPFNKF